MLYYKNPLLKRKLVRASNLAQLGSPQKREFKVR
jgi:hypothetical protein